MFSRRDWIHWSVTAIALSVAVWSLLRPGGSSTDADSTVLPDDRDDTNRQTIIREVVRETAAANRDSGVTGEVGVASPTEALALTYQSDDIAAEVRARFENDHRDSAWAGSMEQRLSTSFQDAFQGTSLNGGIECRSRTCRLHVVASSPEELTQQRKDVRRWIFLTAARCEFMFARASGTEQESIIDCTHSDPTAEPEPERFVPRGL